MSELLNILSSVGFNWHVALANFFNFLIILFLLHTFFFKKLGKTIKERGEIIERGLNQASEGEKILLSASEEKKSIIAEAKKESHAILERAKSDGETIVASMKADADKEIGKAKEALLKKEQDLTTSVEKEFLSRAPSLVASLYKTTLQKEMNQAENDAFIARVK
ncbi:MAG: synthase [Candidatus Parcubacteria bacterium]|jgi:F-type H+-transporting ATPase subunit b